MADIGPPGLAGFIIPMYRRYLDMVIMRIIQRNTEASQVSQLDIAIH